MRSWARCEGGWIGLSRENARPSLLLVNLESGKPPLSRLFWNRLLKSRASAWREGNAWNTMARLKRICPSSMDSPGFAVHADGAQLLEVLRQQAPAWLAQMPSLVPQSERENLQTQVVPQRASGCSAKWLRRSRL